MYKTILFKFHQHVCSPNTYQIKYGETLDFQYQRQLWQHEMPARKINFVAVTLPLELFRVIRCKCWHWISSVLPLLMLTLEDVSLSTQSLLSSEFEKHASEFEKKNENFDKYSCVFETFLTKRWRHFGRRFHTLNNNCLMLSFWFSD